MIKLFNGDCLEVMKDIPDKSVDAIICDLPYGTTVCEWDIVIPFDDLWEQYKRIRKPNTPIILFGIEPFSSYLRVSNIDEYKYELYWEKERATNIFQLKYRPGKVIETISVFYKNQCTYNPQMYEYTGVRRVNTVKDGKLGLLVGGGTVKPYEYNDTGERYPLQIVSFKRDILTSNLHPTQKPLALMEYLVRTYSNEGDLILDNCMGSGTTGLACLKNNRNFIGIEKEEKYFKIAKERMEQPTEVSLF